MSGAQKNVKIGDIRDIKPWEFGRTYVVKDQVEESNKFYICLIQHTSGVFATDLAAVRWLEVSGGVVGSLDLQQVLTNGSTATGISAMSVSTTGGATSFIDTDGTATAAFSLLGTASLGVGAEWGFDDTASGGGIQRFALNGATGIGGVGIILTDTSDSRGIVNAADYSANFINESLVTKRYVDAQVAVDTLYTADSQLTSPRTLDANGNNLTFDNVAQFKVENATDIIFDDTSNISFKIQRSAVTLFSFGASSNFNSSFVVGNTVSDIESIWIGQGRGITIPRLTTAKETALATPTQGLMLFNKDLTRYRAHDGTTYQSLAYLSDFATGQTYTVTNGATSRTIDLSSFTDDQLGDIVATLIADLQSKNILN